MSEPLKSLLDTTSDERARMSETESRLFLTMLMSEHGENPLSMQPLSEEGFEEFLKMEHKDNDGVTPRLHEMVLFGGKILAKRLPLFCDTVPITNTVTLFLVLLCRAHPGRLVMWGYACWRAYQKTGHVLDMEGITRQFPWGFPTDETYQRYWDEQKDGEENRLDYPSEWK